MFLRKLSPLLLVIALFFTGRSASAADTREEAIREFEAAVGLPMEKVAEALTKPFLFQGPFKDKIRAFPYPDILTEADTFTLQRGSAQAALALRAFFADIILGEGKIFERYPELKPLTEVVAEERGISIPKLRKLWEGKKETDVNFTMGPDILRGADGELHLLETNANANLGGFGDAPLLAIAAASVLPADQHPALFESSYSAMADLIDHVKTATHPEAYDLDDIQTIALDGESIWKDPFTDKAESDVEWHRVRFLIQVLSKTRLYGSEILFSPNTKITVGGILQDHPWARVALDMRNRQNHEKFLGADLFFNFNNLFWKDKNSGYLRQLFRKGKVFLNTPGTAEFLSSKAIGTYIPQFIEFYLKESPTFSYPESFLISPHLVLSELEKNPDKLLARFEGFVVKKSNSSQGSHVLISNRLSKEHFILGIKKLAQDRDGYVSDVPLVAQKIVEPAMFHRHSVEYRPLTAVAGLGAISYNSIWGKVGNPQKNSGKANVSAGALELLVVANVPKTHDGYNDCAKIINALPSEFQERRKVYWDRDYQLWRRR